MDLAEAEEMLATSKRYPELVTMLCPPPYGLRGDLLIKKLLAENYVGRPHHVRLQSFHGNFINPEAPAHWRQKIEISGLNVLTLGIYVEVVQRWLGNITGVFARGKILQPLRQGYEVIIPDVLNVLCHFENGAEGVLEFSGVNALSTGDRLEIYGDQGTIIYDFTNDVIHTGKVGDEKLQVMEIPPELESTWRVEEDFLNAVKSKGRVRPHPDFEEGVRYMSSIVTIPTSTLLESTTGSALRSYFRKMFNASSCESLTRKATKVSSRISRTLAVSGLSRNSRIRTSSMSLPLSSTT